LEPVTSIESPLAKENSLRLSARFRENIQISTIQ
jgi:hypothetical protein